jgi:hypothetical protein
VTVDYYADIASQPAAVGKFMRRNSGLNDVTTMSSSLGNDWTMQHQQTSSQSGRQASSASLSQPFAKVAMFKVAPAPPPAAAAAGKSKHRARSSAPATTNAAAPASNLSLLSRLQEESSKSKATIAATSFYGGNNPKSAATDAGSVRGKAATSTGQLSFDDIMNTPNAKRPRLNAKRTSLLGDQTLRKGDDNPADTFGSPILAFETPARPSTRSIAKTQRTLLMDSADYVPDTPDVPRSLQLLQ